MQDKAEFNNNSLYSINNNSNGRTSESLVELPLPSKNLQLGKKIVKTLLIESENVISSTQFNPRPKNDDDDMTNTTTTKDLNEDSDKSQGLKRVSTVVNYENRHAASANVGEFESKLLGSPNVGSIEQMSCAAMFGKQYLLIGNENGLSVIDFSVNSELIKPKQLIRNCSFRKIQILDEYGIMIAISGKKQMIRIYKLDSLLHLIKFMLQSKSERPVDFSKTPTFLKKITDPIQRCDACGNPLDENVNSEGQKNGKTVCTNCKELRRKSTTSIASSTSSESNSSTGNSLFPGKLHQRTLSNITSHLTDYIHHHLSNSLDSVDISAEERINAWNWATDYIKLDNNAKDCTTFDVKETKSYIYLTVVTPHNMVHLFHCEVSAKNTQDFKFELAKTFWVPETPDFISVARDAFVINKIFTGMNGKAASIDAHSGVVTEINMSKVLIPRHVENPVWRSFTPLPHTCSLEFLIEDPVEFETQISVIPLSLNFDAPNSNIFKSPPTSPIASIPPDSTNHAKYVNELRNNPLRRSTYRNRKSISSSNDFQSSGTNSLKKTRRKSVMSDETINSVTSPLGSVASMMLQQENGQEQLVNSEFISPPISPTYTNLSNISAQRDTVSIIQQLPPLMAQLDYVSFPASHASHASHTSPESPESPGSPGSPGSIDSESSSQFLYNSHNSYNPQYPHIYNPESNKVNPTPSGNKQKTPIEVPSPSNLFLATICNVSHLVNNKGEPYKYNRPIRWSISPNEISLLPSFNDIYVVGFQNTIIELASMKSGKVIKKITGGCPVKFLGESWIKKDFNNKTGRDIKEKDKKEFDSGMRRNVFWSCELGEEYYFYRGRILNK